MAFVRLPGHNVFFFLIHLVKRIVVYMCTEAAPFDCFFLDKGRLVKALEEDVRA